MSRDEEWRKEPCKDRFGFAELIVPEAEAWPIEAPEWLVDTILREHELAAKGDAGSRKLFRDYEAAQARIADLEKAQEIRVKAIRDGQARIAELEAENKTLVADLKWPLWVGELQQELKELQADRDRWKALATEVHPDIEAIAEWFAMPAHSHGVFPELFLRKLNAWLARYDAEIKGQENG